MANKLRNETSAEFAGKTRTLRATMEAIVNIEADTGTGVLALLFRFGKAEQRTSDITSVIYHGIRGSGDLSLPRLEVINNVLNMGIPEASLIAMDFLQGFLMGDDEEGKPEAPQAPNA